MALARAYRPQPDDADAESQSGTPSTGAPQAQRPLLRLAPNGSNGAPVSTSPEVGGSEVGGSEVGTTENTNPDAPEDGVTDEEAAQLAASAEEGQQPDEPGSRPPRDPAKVEFLKILQRAKEGDSKAFEQIFQLYHRRIYNAVYGMLGDADDAQDVTQDVFLRLHDALPTLRADEAFSTYLYRIALNLCRDRARRKKRVRFQSMDTPRVDSEGDVEPMEFPDLGKLPEELMTNDELQKRVRQAVNTLSEDHKAVIVMHHFQGMEVNDIAGILNVPTGTVKSRLARGRDQLHRKLRSYLGI
jgi:RNA polymerase sigma-70 factor (ECF subfamily)